MGAPQKHSLAFETDEEKYLLNADLIFPDDQVETFFVGTIKLSLTFEKILNQSSSKSLTEWKASISDISDYTFISELNFQNLVVICKLTF